MAEPIYREPVGTILRFPDGHKVQLVGGQRIQVPAGTIAESGAAGQEPRVLPIAGLVVVLGPAGSTAPVGGATQPPPNILHPGGPSRPGAPSKTWNATPQGVGAEGGYNALKSTFQTHIPGASNQLKALARRPIGG